MNACSESAMPARSSDSTGVSGGGNRGDALLAVDLRPRLLLPGLQQRVSRRGHAVMVRERTAAIGRRPQNSPS
jgi:hypothetical protein